MCGIYGYIGTRNGVRICLEGLSKIEYRGYDSSGISIVGDDGLFIFKEVGKVSLLEKKVEGHTGENVLAHTRWATHGQPSIANAHPQTDLEGNVAVVLNGIIENFELLKKKLIEEGVQFSSETDVEVIPYLIARAYKGDLLIAVQQTLLLLEGSWAVAVQHKAHPDEIIVATRHCPLVIGTKAGESFICSDPNALLHHTREVIYLADDEIARVTKDGVTLFDTSMTKISRETEQLLHSIETPNKGEFEHFTLKEIFEQPQTMRNALFGRFCEQYGTISFEDLKIKTEELANIRNIIIVACGTSWHAGYIASYLLEELAHIPTEVKISSEFRYMNPIVMENTLAIAISQSGETADTIAAVRELKAKGAKVLGITNVQSSLLARLADATILLRAGVEVGVCSTKAFTSQLIVLSLFTLLMARIRVTGKIQGQQYLEELQRLPEKAQKILDQKDYIQKVAKKYAQYTDFFFIGRRYMYPTCLEAALKLKEIAYVNANGYPAGEMKHGPIALISKECPTVAFCADSITYSKVVSNIMEITSRQGKVIAVVYEGTQGIEEIADDVFYIPKTMDEFSPLLATLFGQLFAYYVAEERGAEIDQPRNLAKSVTVE